MNFVDIVTLANADVFDVPIVVLVLGFTFVLAPGVIFHIGVRIYPKDHAQRRELIGEIEEVPYFRRPFWVLSVLLLFATEGLPLRIAARRADRHGSEMQGPEEEQSKSIDQADEERFADADWFTPVDAPTATDTAVLDRDVSSEFRAWRVEFPDYYDDFGSDLDGYSGSLSITPEDVRTALGPQADDLMAAANVDVDELIRLINAETTVLPIIPDELVPNIVTRSALTSARRPRRRRPSADSRRWSGRR